MRIIRKALTTACVALVVATVGLAGYMHSNGKTSYVSDPTAVSLWRRNNTTKNVYSVIPEEIQVFDNSIQTLVTSNSVKYSCGLWQVNTSGNYQIINGVTSSMYDNRKDPGSVIDAEWVVNSNGNIETKL